MLECLDAPNQWSNDQMNKSHPQVWITFKAPFQNIDPGVSKLSCGFHFSDMFIHFHTFSGYCETPQAVFGPQSQASSEMELSPALAASLVQEWDIIIPGGHVLRSPNISSSHGYKETVHVLGWAWSCWFFQNPSSLGCASQVSAPFFKSNDV